MTITRTCLVAGLATGVLLAGGTAASAAVAHPTETPLNVNCPFPNGGDAGDSDNAEGADGGGHGASTADHDRVVPHTHADSRRSHHPAAGAGPSRKKNGQNALSDKGGTGKPATTTGGTDRKGTGGNSKPGTTPGPANSPQA